MATITTKDRTTIFQRTGVEGRSAECVSSRLATVVGRLGRADAVLPSNSHRVVAHDRRGHGRSSQVATGHDMDHYASDASAVVEHLDLRNATLAGESSRIGGVRE